MSDDTKADTETQREVVRALMVLEARLARLRRELTKPIDYDHRENQTGNVLEKELKVVQASSSDALSLASNFIQAAKKRTGWAAYSQYKLRQYETDSAVRKANELFEEALAERAAALAALSGADEADTNPAANTAEISTDNKEQA